jgi:hypothetical protein
MAESAIPGKHEGLEIVLKLLDWPFLLFISLLILAYVFRVQLKALLTRGDISISWGEGRTIRLRDLKDQIDQKLDEVKEEVDELQQGKTKATASQNPPVIGNVGSLSDEEKAKALQRMKDALADEKFRWRSISRLAAIAGISESDATAILRDDPKAIKLSVGESGRRIARLTSR